jgi:hypothetical protein
LNPLYLNGLATNYSVNQHREFTRTTERAVKAALVPFHQNQSPSPVRLRSSAGRRPDERHSDRLMA